MARCIAESLRSWFKHCPALSDKSSFWIDYLGARATEYAIYLIPTQITASTDILGNTHVNHIQEQNFIFASKEAYGHEIVQNLQNLGFFEEIIKWMLARNAAKDFFTMDSGEVISILPTTTPSLLVADANTARYQIQCKLRYTRKEV